MGCILIYAHLISEGTDMVVEPKSIAACSCLLLRLVLARRNSYYFDSALVASYIQESLLF